MSHGNHDGCCTAMRIGKVLLIIGGLNWGLVGIGMLMNKGIEAWNVVHLIAGSMPTLEGIIYVIVGIAAAMKLIGCRCKKCVACMNGKCEDGSAEEVKM